MTRGGSVGGIARIVRGLTKVARNPRVAMRVLWPRFSPITTGSPDPEARRIARWSFGALDREPVTAVFPGIETIDVNVIRTFDRQPGMSLDPSEILILAAMVRLLKPRRLLEIGTFDGNTTLNLAANCPSGARVFTLDLPADWGGDFALDVPSLQENAVVGDITGIQFRDSPLRDRITQLFDDSARFDWDRFAPFDLIFIDGCHTYDYVRSDTLNALRVLRPGGTLVWHDYGMLEDVSRAVDETAGQISVRALQGTRLAVGFPRTPPPERPPSPPGMAFP